MSYGRAAASFAIDAYCTAVRVTDDVHRVGALGSRAGRGLRGAAYGTARLHHEAQAQRMKLVRGHIVSGEIFHGDGDRQRAVTQLSTEWAGFALDMIGAASDPSAPASVKAWASINVAPVLLEWQAFQANETSSWTARFATDWAAFVAWQERLRRLRELARVQGIALASPEPVDLPHTIWEKGEAGAGGKADVLWTALKTIVYAAVGITGVVTLYAVARDVRGGGLRRPPETE